MAAKKSSDHDIQNTITVHGAREHNLKSLTVSIPKNKLVIITGPSGSGKSSLALDTLYAEGRRRYVESLSSYARQFLGVTKKPDVDKIEGLCPAIAIDQKTVGYNPRSTVGTITEIYDYMRVLFARVGTPHCPNCNIPIREESPQTITNLVLQNQAGKEVTWAAPIAIDRKGEFTNQLLELYEKGYYRFMIDGEKYRFTDKDQIETLGLKKSYKHTIDVILDKFTIDTKERVRIQEAIEKSFRITKGFCKASIEGESEAKEILYSAERICIECGSSSPEMEPRLFSFNSPLGACKSCHGLGFIQEWPWAAGEKEHWKTKYPDHFAQYAKNITCPDCQGDRLCPEARAVFINKKSIVELNRDSIEKLYKFFEKLELDEQEAQIAEGLVKEIRARISFLVNVGLSYLTLGRTARSLSGGEGQRIRLATQIGSALSGVLYVLDEPSIGLHQRDNDRLIETLKKLRDHGNTILVVEHDMDTIKNSDYVIDIGPAAGLLGGEVTAYGTPQEIKKNKNSLTGKFLSGEREIKTPQKRRYSQGIITVRGASINNLRDVTVDFPIGCLVAVSGVSGSGKSSLVMHTLAPTLTNYFKKGHSGGHGADGVDGIDQIANCVLVNQSPIGRTPRSNPATYLGIFDDIRALFAKLPESKARGYDVGRFSFNVAKGRCSTCRGDGKIKISMHFLEDVEIVCKTCLGQRYNPQTLEIKFNGKNIADILNLSVLEGLEFFKNFPRLQKRLQLLVDVGLDYLKLGQPSTTLSGGEAQRIKLVNELAKRGKNTFYILDEPTTGLHSCDVEKLLEVMNRLVDQGNSVVVIEHNLDVLKSADYIIDIGPEGGDRGGFVVATGTPEEVAQSERSITGRYLKSEL